MSKSPRILLISGIMPCSNYSGGLFLQQLLKVAPPLVGIFAIQNPTLVPHVDPELLAQVPLRVLHRPKDGYPSDQRESDVRRAELDSEKNFIPQAVEEVIEFARETRPTDIWIVIEGQTQIRLADLLLNRIDIPLRVQVMDPPGWWLRAHHLDPITSREMLERFESILRRSRACAAASWAMAKDYQQRFEVKVAAVVPALDRTMAMPPAKAPAPRALRVGFAGQIYANKEFDTLVEAMHSLRAEGFREIIEIHAFSATIPVESHGSLVKIHPWCKQAELIRELAEMDLLYCPYWFADEMREEARLSFPSKLTTYLATGRPVLFHGPADSSPGTFLRRAEAAFCCFIPGVHAMRQALIRSVSDLARYGQITQKGREAFEEYLDMSALQRSFRAFMDMPQAVHETDGRPLAAGALARTNVDPAREVHRPVILLACFPMSVHAARWINILRTGPWRAVIFPSVLQEYCFEFGELVPVQNSEDVALLKQGEIGIVDSALLESVLDSPHERAVGYRSPQSAVALTDDVRPSPESLSRVLDWMNPDVLHSLELQHAGYLCLEVHRRRRGKLPLWLASSWGSDTFLYRKLPEHHAKLTEMCRALDGFHSDCSRDYSLVGEMGFRGTYFPDMAASGGVDLSSYPDPSCLPPPSKRRVILVKGYHGWAGRGLDIMLALHMIAPKLKGFQIRMFHCGPSGARMVEALRREDGLDVSIDPYYVDQSRAVERLAQARLVIGYGISDGISTTLLEAMAVGTFCVQASTACGCEWVRPGIDGIEVPPHDVEQLAEAILRAVTDDDLVDGAVIRNRREIESRWSFSAVAPKMHRGYRELIEGPRAVDKASPQPHVEA